MIKFINNNILKIIIVVVIIVIFVAVKIFEIDRYLTFENLNKYKIILKDFVNLNYIYSIFIFIILYIVITGLSIPGATIGATFAFLISRFVFGKSFQDKYSDHLKKFNDELAKNGKFYLLTLRFIPAFPFFLINILTGLTKITTSTGILPASLVYTFAGSNLYNINSPKDILSIPVLIAFLFLAILSIIPVYNEGKIINDAIENLLRITKDFHVEIIISDGNNGTTLDEVRFDNVIKVSSLKGRGLQMNTGVKSANGKILVFLHCDTILPENAFLKIEETVSKYKAGAFDLGIDSKKIIFRIIERISSLRSRLTRIPYSDQVFFIAKEYFDSLDGFKEIPIMEDIEIMERIKKRRDKIFIVSERVLTSSRKSEQNGIFYCTVRNWILVILYKK